MSVGSEIGTQPGAGAQRAIRMDVAAPVNLSVPTISGTAQIGQTLNAAPGAWDSGTTPTYSYQWRRGGTAISGATAQNYTPVTADYQAALSVTVIATNSIGASDAVTSNATASVIDAAPANSVAPALSTSTPSVGQSISVGTGTWDSLSTLSYSYQWQADGVAIAGATSASYTPVSGDIGTLLRCLVTASNEGGSSASLSNVSAAVSEAPANPAVASLNFTGSDSYLSQSNANWGSYNRSKFAIAGAFRLDTLSSSAHLLSRNNGSVALGREFVMQIQNTGALTLQWWSAGGNDNIASATGAVQANQWYAFLAHYDAANATQNQRAKLWINGVDLNRTPSAWPSTAIDNTGTFTLVGCSFNSSSLPTGLLDGLIHTLAFFDGVLPDPTDVFDGTAGKLKPLHLLSSAKMLLTGQSAGDDYFLPDWTVQNVTTSTNLP